MGPSDWPKIGLWTRTVKIYDLDYGMVVMIMIFMIYIICDVNLCNNDDYEMNE